MDRRALRVIAELTSFLCAPPQSRRSDLHCSRRHRRCFLLQDRTRERHHFRVELHFTLVGLVSISASSALSAQKNES